MPDNHLIFPDGFLWGTGTSSHQIEGGNDNNDWWDWERVPGHIRDGNASGLACDHYHRYCEDWALARAMGQNAHRLSIEWSRVEPQEGEWNAEALAHYRSVLEAMRDHSLEPMVTLHHFTNPRWLVAKGGWENPAVVLHFTRYAARVVGELGDLCRLWVTINEPMVCFYEGYLTRRWPPGSGGFFRGLHSVRHMIQAHARTYRLIHKAQGSSEVGIAHNMRLFDPADPRRLLDRMVGAGEDYLFNRIVLWALLDGYQRIPLGRGQYLAEADDSLDFIGLNYYARDMVSFALRGATTLVSRNFASPGAETDLFGWEVYPEGLYRLLKQLSVFGKPIYVTENGLADRTDEKRPRYLVESVAAMWRALSEGAPVRGYFHWTLMDNFEWAEGYSVPFGLVAVNRETQERTIKTSGQVYSKICRANGVPAALAASYIPSEQG